jgi:hypothetical protein
MAFKMKPKGFQMKSPNKNYKNPRDYRVFNMGNEADAPMEMHSPTDMEKTPAYMKSPVKNTGEAFAREIKEMDYEGNMPAESFKRIKNQHDKGHAQGDPHAPAKMKSGFKMKEGSPFERNFGVGSPVKLRPRYIDGVEVTDEEFAAFEEKGKDLQHKSWGAADDQYLITADNEGIILEPQTLELDLQVNLPIPERMVHMLLQILTQLVIMITLEVKKMNSCQKLRKSLKNIQEVKTGQTKQMI